MPTPLEVDTPAYKKALRHHLKSSKTAPAEAIPALREQEKCFKTRFPPPSLENVLDISWDETHGLGWKGSQILEALIPFRCEGGKRAFGFQSLPGFVLLPGFLEPLEQRELIRDTLEKHARSPNENNLDTHYHVPQEGLWLMWREYRKKRQEDPDTKEPIISTKAAPGSDAIAETKRTLIDNKPASVQNFARMQAIAKPPPPPSSTLHPVPLSSIVPKLRWSNIGHFYHWGTKSYQFFDRTLVPIPSDIREICQRAVRSVDWNSVWSGGRDGEGEWEMGKPNWATWKETFEPDAGIINFYQLRDTLMAHVDRSELSSTSPLVSISLGQAAIFLIGGTTRDEKGIPIILRSGDVLIMSGPQCRRAYHGVPRILEGSLPSHLKEISEDDEAWSLISEYLETSRININVRQVFPPGFPYEEHNLGHLVR